MLKHPGLTEYAESYQQKNLPPPVQSISVAKLTTCPVSITNINDDLYPGESSKVYCRWLL